MTEYTAEWGVLPKRLSDGSTVYDVVLTNDDDFRGRFDAVNKQHADALARSLNRCGSWEFVCEADRQKDGEL